MNPPPAADGRRGPFWAWGLVALIVVAAAAVRYRLLGLPLDRDEGEYAYFGQLLLQGIPPYAAAYNFKMPGIYGVYALILAVFGQTPTGVHLGLLLANAASIVLVLALGTRLGGPIAGAAASATYAALSLSPRLFFPTAYAEHFVLPPALAGVLVLLRATGRAGVGTFFWSGVLFGAAFLV